MYRSTPPHFQVGATLQIGVSTPYTSSLGTVNDRLASKKTRYVCTRALRKETKAYIYAQMYRTAGARVMRCKRSSVELTKQSLPKQSNQPSAVCTKFCRHRSVNSSNGSDLVLKIPVTRPYQLPCGSTTFKRIGVIIICTSSMGTKNGL